MTPASKPSDPLEAGLLLARSLEQHGVSYALGGALAYGIWGIPRATLDVDANVFVEDDELQLVATALVALGIPADLEQMKRESEARGMFSARFGVYRLDLFTPSIAFAREAEKTRRLIEVDGESAYFLSAEALAVFKLLFFRPKDIVDLERLVEVQGPKLDVAYVRQHLVTLMGESDERVSRWDQLTGQVPEASPV